MAQHRPDEIAGKAMLLIQHNGKLLLSEGYDKNTDEHFYRLLGGSLNFGERSEDGVRREIQEELKSEIDNLHLITVIENIFTFEGERGHQIVFLYGGDLSNKDLYNQPVIHIIDSREFDAKWFLMEEILKGDRLIYPKYDYAKILN